jgi:hypothetical protein
MGSLQNIKEDEPYGKMDIERGDLLGMMKKNALFTYPSHTWLHTKNTPKFPFERVRLQSSIFGRKLVPC